MTAHPNFNFFQAPGSQIYAINFYFLLGIAIFDHFEAVIMGTEAQNNFNKQSK